VAEFPGDYRTDEPNADVPLYHGPMKLTVAEQSLVVDGTIELHWLPDLEIRFRVDDIPIKRRFPQPLID